MASQLAHLSRRVQFHHVVWLTVLLLELPDSINSR